MKRVVWLMVSASIFAAGLAGMAISQTRDNKLVTPEEIQWGAAPAKITYRRTAVDSIEIFYREAGRSNAPALLLLHGFPTASHMFRCLIPQLADRFHVIAPDLPGFGQSDMPERTKFRYTFDNIAELLTASLK